MFETIGFLILGGAAGAFAVKYLRHRLERPAVHPKDAVAGPGAPVPPVPPSPVSLVPPPPPEVASHEDRYPGHDVMNPDNPVRYNLRFPHKAHPVDLAGFIDFIQKNASQYTGHADTDDETIVSFTERPDDQVVKSIWSEWEGL